MGIIDGFVYAHSHHRRNVDNRGNFLEIVWKGNFRLPKPNIPIFPTPGPQRAKKGNDFHGWLFTLIEELTLLMVKPWLTGALSLARLMGDYIYIYIYIHGVSSNRRGIFKHKMSVS